MSDFRVPFGPSETEFTEKRSRFIGHLLPAETEEQAREFIAQMKKKYYDARHNCWCYLIGGDTMRYGDDGEPQGTAGQPMLNVFQRENVTNVVCVVTRYFGGILLGAGGLTRAYSKSARDALVAAGVSEMGLWAMADIPCPYALFERVRGEVTALGGTVDSADYGADIRLTVSLPAENTAALRERLTELSAGGIVLTVTAEAYRDLHTRYGVQRPGNSVVLISRNDHPSAGLHQRMHGNVQPMCSAGGEHHSRRISHAKQLCCQCAALQVCFLRRPRGRITPPPRRG